MNSLMFLLMGRQLNFQQLEKYIENQRNRRRWIFKRLADLLFGIVCLFYGDLKLQVTTQTGGTADADTPNEWNDASGLAGLGKVPGGSDPSKPSADEKLNAIMAGLKSVQHGMLLREFLRPLFITAAELLAELMSPDPMMLQLFSQMGVGGGGGPSGQTIQVTLPPPPPGFGGR